jgi:putative membrane protein
MIPAEPGLDRSTQLAVDRTDLASHRTSMANVRSHMANERTHLAYLRTALSLLTFGITLNRFSIYIRENKPLSVSSPHSLERLYETEFVGIGMVVIGISILIWALFRYRQMEREVESDTYASPMASLMVLSLSIVFLGGLSAAWMILSRE